MNAKPRLVVLTGAGISAESGLKTFRDSEDGLWNGYDIEEVATPAAWRRQPQLVLDFYNYRRREVLKAEPNEAHRCLAAMEAEYDVHIITQNIDDLHERAGSSRVLHLHGEILKMRSERNDELLYDIRTDIALGDKAEDGAQLRPHIVWFGEAVPLIGEAAALAATALVFAIIGTSLLVYPAAGLVQYVPQGCQVWVIDKQLPTGSSKWHGIQMPASQGVAHWWQRLKDSRPAMDS
ncbi:MAG: NAD-dependent deacylase [Chitinophagaceae bacterium]|jgi:NAD-dependent deacetylase|nr:NAD-dependent deacylase [Chitinophagaceae bacterium]